MKKIIIFLMTLILVGMLSAVAVSAGTQDPPGCDANAVTLSLTIYRSDGTTSISGGDTVVAGELIKYRATLSHAGGTSCNYVNGTVSIETPNGVLHDVTPGGNVPLVESGSPFISDYADYVVDSADVDGNNQFTAFANYENGVSLTGADDEAAASLSKKTNFEQEFVSVVKTAEETLEESYDWTIDKLVDINSHTLFDGESASSEYTVAVTKTGPVEDSWRVTGDIVITNDAQFADATITDVADSIEGIGSVTVLCPETLPHVLAPGESITCTYDRELPDGSTRVNTATVTTSGDVGGGADNETIDFSEAQVVGVQSNEIDVTDTNVQGSWNFVESGFETYTLDFDCSDVEYVDGHAQYTLDNTAEIVQTGASASEQVTVDCYELDVQKTATPMIEEGYTWTIDKSVTPAQWDLFDGDTGTSEYTVTADREVDTTSYSATGTVTISNPSTEDAVLSDVTDSLGDISCPSLTVPAGGNIVCNYTVNLPNGNPVTNTVTVTGPAGTEYVATADIDFDGVEPEVSNEMITIDDTNGMSWNFTDDGEVTYEDTFACGQDEGTHQNNISVSGTQLFDSASVQVNCYDLSIEKTADATFDRQHEWTIDKTASDSELLLQPGEIYTVDYDVTVAESSTDMNHQISGEITVTNNHPTLDADLTAVVDSLANVTCPSLTVPANGGTVVCTYATSGDGSETLNEATATQQNHNYDSVGVPTESGTTGYDASASVNYILMNEVDECVDVNDTNVGSLGTVCEDDQDKMFSYSVDLNYTECSETGYEHNNTAMFVTNDTNTTGEDSWTVTVDVPCVEMCTLTQGYWKTHSQEGPAPYDPNWELLGDIDNDGTNETQGEEFYLSGQTWYEVFWTPPKGGNAYYKLAHQYEAAYLNILVGASTTSEVDDAMSGAEDFFNTYEPEDLEAKGKAKKLIKDLIDDANGWASTLASYNEGLIGPGHCDEQVPE